MLEGNAVNGDASVLIDEVVLANIDRIEKDFILDVRIVSLHEEVEQLAHLLRSVDVQFGSSPQQVHRAYQSRQSENVVAMIVTDEDVTDVHHREPHQLHPRLSPFAAIEHEVFATHIQYLRSRLVASGGLCRAATQYVQFKWFHVCCSKEKPPPLYWGWGLLKSPP